MKIGKTCFPNLVVFLLCIIEYQDCYSQDNFHADSFFSNMEEIHLINGRLFRFVYRIWILTGSVPAESHNVEEGRLFMQRRYVHK